MSDQNGAGQTRPTALPIVINAQYVKDFSFENPNAPQTLLPGQPAPQVSVGVDVRSQQVGETLYEVVLEMRCEAKIAENTAFLVELSYAGLFTVTGLAEEHIKPVLLIEAPRLLFPFARQIVAESVQNLGFPPVLLDPIDFAAAYVAQQEQQGQLSGQPGGEGEPPVGHA
jgi:preprotein translocase subunit SecB